MTMDLNSVSSIQEFYDHLHRGKPFVSFWGNRFVMIDSQYAALDSLPGSVWRLVKKNPHFSAEEREIGREIEKQVGSFYKETKKLARTRNLISRLFYSIIEWWIRNVKDFGYGDRMQWKGTKVFNTFSEPQYRKQFGCPPPIPPNYPSFKGGSRRWNIGSSF